MLQDVVYFTTLAAEKSNMKRIAILMLVALVSLTACHKKMAQSGNPEARYISENKGLAKKMGRKHGIPPSILLAQAAIASKNGTTEMAEGARNHFAIKCDRRYHGPTWYSKKGGINECYRKYKSVAAGYKDHCKIIGQDKRFRNLYRLERGDYKGWANGLRDSAYTTNSRYNTQLITFIEKYKLHDMD
jgi:flagellum-specific peptidoglycan hydrolase FlgJ